MIEKKKEKIRESNIYLKTPFLKYSAITINLEPILGNLILFNWQYTGDIYWIFMFIILSYFGSIGYFILIIFL